MLPTRVELRWIKTYRTYMCTEVIYKL